MMMFSDHKLLCCVLVALVLLSAVSALRNPEAAVSLAQAGEVQIVGGSKCATAWGLGLALAAASLSPCGVLCASLAWYDLALIGAYCP